MEGRILVANKRLSTSLVAELTKQLIERSRDLIGEQPLLAGITSPDTDPDAFIAVHPGAAAFYNGTEESFMDRYRRMVRAAKITPAEKPG